MFSFIITIICIALVAALAPAGIYNWGQGHKTPSGLTERKFSPYRFSHLM